MSDTAFNRGWIVTLAGFGINLALGVLYSWSVFAKEIVAEWRWSTGEASVPYATAVAFFAIVLAFGGRAQDRIGPRWVATVGGALVGTGLLISGLAAPGNHLPLVLGFGVLTGSGIALGFVSSFPAAAKWFSPKRRGLITGLVVSGFGIASVYIAPLTQYLLGQVGIERTFLGLGTAFLIVTVVLAQFLRNPPPGYVAPGVTATALDEKGGPCPPAGQDVDWHEMIRTRQFVLLWLMYGLTAFAGIMVIGHMAEITRVELGVDLGFLLVAVLAVGNATGRIVAGLVTDRIGAVRTMTIVFSAQTLVLALLGAAGSAPVLAALAFAIGFGYGADLSLFPCVVAEYFGSANQGVNYGVVFTSWGVGGVFGSMSAAAIVDATGTYAPAYWAAAGMCALAASLSLVTHAPRRAPAAPPLPTS